VQVYTILGLVFFLALLQNTMLPFASNALNRLELFALCTAFVTFDAGLYLGSPTASRSSRMLVNASVFIANAVFLGVAAAMIVGSRLCGRCQSSGMSRQSEMLQ